MSDPILLWNDVALEANRVSHTNGQGEQAGPPLSARALAIVHLAMYDAFAGCVNDPDLPLYYLPELQPHLPPANTPPEEAVAVAASLTLCWLFPSQESAFRRLRDAVTTDETSDAWQFGVAVYNAVKADREGDPGVGSATYRPSSARGHHRPDPDNLPQPIHAPDYGRLSKGFGITTRFENAAPPFGDGDDPEYLRALREVRGKGIKPELMGTLPKGITPRTTDETVIGLYWAYDGVPQLGTPPRLYNQIVREVAASQGNTPAQNARLFAFVNVAMADAGILAWDQKYVHDFWRPVVGIREHDKSMGPDAGTPADDISNDCDPAWLPLGGPNTNRIGKNFTPPFPAYPSGHATFGAAALHSVRLFYGQGGTFKDGNLSPDNLMNGVAFASEELNGVNTDNTGAARPRHLRKFDDGLWQAIEENGRSRVYLGVHWVFDAFAVHKNGEPDLYRKDAAGRTTGGVPLGLLIAEDVFTHGNGKGPRKSTVPPRPDLAQEQAVGRAATFASSYLT
jgi:hypothetical protein